MYNNKEQQLVFYKNNGLLKSTERFYLDYGEVNIKYLYPPSKLSNYLRMARAGTYKEYEVAWRISRRNAEQTGPHQLHAMDSRNI